jgi:hypothetical protein
MGEFKYNIFNILLRTFVNVTMHPQHNKKTLEGKKRNKELGELK